MKVEIDLNEVFAHAVQHMEAPEDVRWSVGMALQDLYWDAWVRDLQTKLTAAYEEQNQMKQPEDNRTLDIFDEMHEPIAPEVRTANVNLLKQLIYKDVADRRVGDMPDETKATLQVIWEQLNGAMYDLTEGDMGDAIPTILECIERLEAMGVGK